MSAETKIRVYYNSACPVCEFGIEAQKLKSTVCGVEFEDVHLDKAKVAELGAELESVRERLHVIDTEGQLRVGFEAFLVIWENSPTEQWKARVGKIVGLRWLLNQGYKLFARGLYLWNRALKHW